jgi:uncharacterized protein YjbI with pentapeptide repeats
MSFSPEIEAKRLIRPPRKPYVAPVAPRLELRHKSGKALFSLETFDFNALITQALSESIDLSGVVLRPFVRNHLQLEHVELALRHVDFSKRDLSRAEFSNTRVFDCNFSGASLFGANLQDTVFIGCDFYGVNLRHAKFKETALRSQRPLFMDCLLSELILDSQFEMYLIKEGYAVPSKEDFYDDVSDYQDDEPTDFGDASNYDEA